MAKNSSEIITDIIEMVDRKVIDLTYREKINVQMRIDEVIPFLEEVLALAKDDQSSRKFDLTESKTGTCTIAYQVNGESASTGANVLKYGDKLKITVIIKRNKIAFIPRSINFTGTFESPMANVRKRKHIPYPIKLSTTKREIT